MRALTQEGITEHKHLKMNVTFFFCSNQQLFYNISHILTASYRPTDTLQKMLKRMFRASCAETANLFFSFLSLEHLNENKIFVP